MVENDIATSWKCCHSHIHSCTCRASAKYVVVPTNLWLNLQLMAQFSRTSGTNVVIRLLSNRAEITMSISSVQDSEAPQRGRCSRSRRGRARRRTSPRSDLRWSRGSRARILPSPPKCEILKMYTMRKHTPSGESSPDPEVIRSDSMGTTTEISQNSSSSSSPEEHLSRPHGRDNPKKEFQIHMSTGTQPYAFRKHATKHKYRPGNAEPTLRALDCPQMKNDAVGVTVTQCVRAVRNLQTRDASQRLHTPLHLCIGCRVRCVRPVPGHDALVDPSRESDVPGRIQALKMQEKPSCLVVCGIPSDRTCD